ITKSDAVNAAYMASGQESAQDFNEWLKNTPFLQPSDVADAVVYVLSTPPHVQVHELIMRPVGEQI
ncbi:hypothetical protein PPYR_08782, partial [Photinus pyralis]